MSVSLTAQQLQEQHGHLLLQPPYSEATSAYFLHRALTASGFVVSQAAVRQWWNKYKLAVGQGALRSAQELEDQHGDSIRPCLACFFSIFMFS